MTTTGRRRRALLTIAVAATIGLAACTGAIDPPTDPTGNSPAAPAPTASAPPSDRLTDPGSGAGGGVPGDPGTGIGGPANPGQVGPGAGQPTIVQPVPGRANPHSVAPIAIQASIDGRHVLVKISWYGGVEPCSVLDSVKVERAASDIAVTPFEGSSRAGVACIDIALLKATIVDLGKLDPGTYRILSPGSDAPPAVITID